MLARRRSLDYHEYVMLGAIITSGISLSAWMLPSLIDNWRSVTDNPTSPGAVFTLIHLTVGILAGASAVRIVLPMKTEFLTVFIKIKRIKKTMRITFTLWMATVLMEVFLVGIQSSCGVLSGRLRRRQ